MRLVRILLVVLAVVTVGLAGWALGARGGYTTTAAGDPTPAASDPAAPAVTTPAPVPGGRATPDLATPDPTVPADTTRPAPQRPRILGFGSEPVLPVEGGYWRLVPGGGLVTFVLDAPNATRVEFWLTPAGTGTAGLARKLGQDTNGRDGWLFNWRYPNQPIQAHLTVKAIGPGGTATETIGVYQPHPAEQP
jgi:hypothetical protein